MRTTRTLAFSVVPALLLAAGVSARADGLVQLELVGEGRGSALVFQEWARALSKAGVRNVRIRSGKAADQVGITIRGTKESPIYLVTGIVKSRDELVLPGGSYTRRDVGRLAQWLNDLARHGPDGPKAQPKSVFGLGPEQFRRLQADLSQPLGFSTKGLTRDRAVEGIRRRLKLPLAIDPELARSLAEDTLAEELSGLSCGTSLAYVLRPMGMCLVPRPGARGPEYTIAPAKEGLPVWPIGFEPGKPPVDVLPALYEIHSINIQRVSAAAAMEALGKRLKVPLLIDHNALARHGIDPAKVAVSHPRQRVSYSTALKRVLYQAKLKSELRVDEAGQPLLWITTIKPI